MLGTFYTKFESGKILKNSFQKIVLFINNLGVVKPGFPDSEWILNINKKKLIHEFQHLVKEEFKNEEEREKKDADVFHLEDNPWVFQKDIDRQAHEEQKLRSVMTKLDHIGVLISEIPELDCNETTRANTRATKGVDRDHPLSRD
jgi:hypothetical protein